MEPSQGEEVTNGEVDIRKAYDNLVAKQHSMSLKEAPDEEGVVVERDPEGEIKERKSEPCRGKGNGSRMDYEVGEGIRMMKQAVWM